jgi:hypothetical protein
MHMSNTHDSRSGKPFSEVRLIHRNNPGAQWHNSARDLHEPDGKFAFQRLEKEIFQPFLNPRFKFPKQSKFFMIGSCFARGLEAALNGAGFQVKSLSKDLDQYLPDRPGVTALGATNRYNTASIYNEVLWALDPSAPFPEDALVDLDDGLCVDPHMTPVFSLADRDTTLARRNIFNAINKNLAEVDVVIVTLGLVEVWIDSALGLVTNVTPDPRLLRKHPNRFHFKRLNFQENFQMLENIHELLHRFGKPDHKIIVTTSPVPLSNTFENEDIVIANTYSKSALRTAATEWAEAHENIDYFPSYEIVMNSARRRAWMDDKRHVRGELAQFIMKLFVKNYIEEVSDATIKLEAEAVY